MTDPWADLTAELQAHRDWHRRPTHNPSVSAYVAVQDNGEYFGGVHEDGEWLDDENMAASGESPEAVIADLIRRLREYRADLDRQLDEGERDDA